MMMMRSIGGGAPSFCFALLLFLLLFIAEFQTSHAVSNCTRKINGKTVEPVECSVCAIYQCYKKIGNVNDKERKEIWGRGCPHHFYEDCSNSKWSKSVAFVKTKTKLCYWDGIVYYCSCDTDECVDKKHDVCHDRDEKLGTADHPDWYCEEPGDKDCPAKLYSNSGNSKGDGSNNAPITINVHNNITNTIADSNSSVSNSAIKLAGIIMVATGWVLF